MLDRIIHFSIHQKVVVGFFVLALVARGAYSVTQLPIDAIPDITNNQVQVITQSPALAATEVEKLITYPVEAAMATVPGLQEMRSFSRFGLSVVTLVFRDNVDIYWARQQVNERLSPLIAQLPPGIGLPEMAPVSTGLGEIYQYVLTVKPGFEKKHDAMSLRTLQDWQVRRQLLGTPGVADVSSFGGFVRQYEIALDPNRLISLGLSMTEIFDAVERNNRSTGGAYIEKRQQAYFIRTEGLVRSAEDIGKIVVRNGPGTVPLLVRDVATVREGHDARYGALTLNAEGETVGGIVLMLKGANSSTVIADVKGRIEQIQRSLPPGVVIVPFLDRAQLVRRTISTIGQNLAEGALIVVFVLVLFLGNFRAGLLVASVIPLALLFAISMMNLFGVSGNLMSLGAIDFGLVVDGAVIIVEAILHRIAHLGHERQGLPLNRQDMKAEVYHAASRIRSSAAFGEIIILIVYLPILALVGVEGKMFRPMALTVGFAIMGAFILSLTYVPMMSALVLSRSTQHRRNVSDKMMDFLQRMYAPVLRACLRFRALVLGVALVLLALSLVLFLRMGGEFIPTLDEGGFAVETRVGSGSSINETVRVATQAGAILRKQFPEVTSVVGRIGTSQIPTDPMPVESCDLIIGLKPHTEWTSAHNREALAQKMQQALEVIPGVEFGFQQPIQMRFNELMTGARQDVVLKIYGEDFGVLAEQARLLAGLIRKVEGAEDLYVEKISGLPQIVVRINRERLAQFGLSVDDVNRVVQTAFAGATAGYVYEGERRFELVVRMNPESRTDLESIRAVPVKTADGQMVQLAQLADVSLEENISQIQRDDAKRRITVGFNVRGRDVQTVVEELSALVDKDLHLPPGYHVSYGGVFRNLEEARSRLMVAVPVALALIFALLYFSFGSLRQSLLIFSAIPLSAIGGVLALWLRGMPFSISAGVGFIALFGVAVLNGIVLIGYYNQLRAEGMNNLNDVVQQGSSTRLRPVLMTAAVASLGFLPMALSTSAGAEVQKPLATVVIGGLLSSTLLTLFVVPLLYVLSESWATRRGKTGNVMPGGDKDGGDIADGGDTTNGGITATATTVVAVLVLLWPLGAGAQNAAPNPVPRTLSLAQALSAARQHSPALQAAAYRHQAQQALRPTRSEIGPTVLQLQSGQYNSAWWDNNLTLSQTLPFPTVFATRTRYLDALALSGEHAARLDRRDLELDLSLAYSEWQYWLAQQQLYDAQDSLAQKFEKVAELKLRTGESTQLELSTARLLRQEAQTRLGQAAAEARAREARISILTGEKGPLTPADTLHALALETLSDTARVAAHPRLLYLRQLADIQRRQASLERSKLLPEITLGYFNQSLTGILNTSRDPNATGTFVGPETRFQGFQLGFTLPIWPKPQLARAQAANLEALALEAQARQAQQNLNSELQQETQRWLALSAALQRYEKESLPTARQMLAQGYRAYAAGDIGYNEYAQLLSRSMDVQLAYLALLGRHNTSVISLHYYLNIP